MISLIMWSKMYCIGLSVVAAPRYYGDRGCITRRQWVYWTSRLEEALLSAPALDLLCSQKHLSRSRGEKSNFKWAEAWSRQPSTLTFIHRQTCFTFSSPTFSWFGGGSGEPFRSEPFFFWQGLVTSRPHGNGRRWPVSASPVTSSVQVTVKTSFLFLHKRCGLKKNSAAEVVKWWMVMSRPAHESKVIHK